MQGLGGMSADLDCEIAPNIDPTLNGFCRIS